MQLCEDYMSVSRTIQILAVVLAVVATALIVHWLQQPAPITDNAVLADVPCPALSRLQVFSHRGLSGEGNELPTSAIVTESSFLALHRQGVMAFDMDLFYTTDETQFVAHPVSLAAALRVPSVFALSDRQLEAAVESVAPGRRLLRASRLLELAAAHVPNLTLALDLKSDPRGARLAYRRQLEWLVQRVTTLQLVRSTLVWVADASLATRIQRTAPPPLRLGKPMYDVRAPLARDGRPQCALGQLAAGDAARFAFLGPSRRCANALLLRDDATARWRRATGGRGWLVWVVDRPPELAELLQLGVDQVISNHPLMMQAAVEAARVRRGCE